MTKPTVTCPTCGAPLVAWLSTEQIAQQLGVTARTVRKRIASCEIPATRIGPRLWRVRHADFHAYLRARSGLQIE